MYYSRFNSGSLLCRAVASRDVSRVEALLRQRAAIEDGDMPLHLAAEMSCVEIVRLLLSYSFPVNARDDYEQTPLHTACGLGARDVVEVLLAAGADWSATTSFGKTPLHSVAGGCVGAGAARAEIATALVGRGCLVDARENAGRTPLWMAVGTGVSQPDDVRRNNVLPLIRRLLELGADPNLCAGGEQGSPLLVARDGARPWPEAFEVMSMSAALGLAACEGRAKQEQAVEPEDTEIEDLLRRAVDRLMRARGSTSEIRAAIDLYLAEGDSQHRSPLELRDYFDISCPGLAQKAGYTESEQEEASQLFDEVS